MTKITIFGGDSRMVTAYKELKNYGFAVDTLGLFENDCASGTDSDVYLLPVPASRDKRTVCTPLTHKIIPISYIEDTAFDKLVLTGVYEPCVKRCINYCKNEDYALKNAVLTAEGTICSAIEKTDFSLFGSNIAVIGYGRCGRALCERLKPFSDRITVFARRQEVRNQIEKDGFTSQDTLNIGKYANSFNIIFNTVDVPLLKNTETSAYIFDISTDGCIEIYKSHEYNYFKLPALPSKTAPKSAGTILAQTVEQIIKERL